MILVVGLSGFFFLTIAVIAARGALTRDSGDNLKAAFLPKSRTEMIKGIAAVAIVFSHIASYSKGSAPSGLLRYYNLVCCSLGGIGVNLFFFFSGFGNYFSIRKNKKHRIVWLWKRCATLLIVYAVCHLLVLSVLLVGGYRTDLASVRKDFLHLTIPYSSVWYVKIQLLAYCFLALGSVLENRNHQTTVVAILCLASSLILYFAGLDEKWWKSTLCFSVGVFCGAYKSEVEGFLASHDKSAWICSLALLPVAYVAAVLIDMYAIKTIGNLVLCIVMVILIQYLRMDDKIYCKIGSYSLTLYLIHRSFVAWTLDDGVTTVSRVAMIVVASALFTVLAKWISDKAVSICFVKKQN